jgi:hypothetical protein
MDTNNSSSSSCDARIHAYKNGKTMEQCKDQARKNTELLSEEILKKRRDFMDKNIRSYRL